VTLPTRTLSERPDLDQLKRQAKELFRSFVAGEPDAAAEVRAHYRGADPAAFALHDAQLVIARAYGFESWPRLKAFVDGVTVARLADAVRAADLARARAMLQVRPELVHLDLAENDEHRALHYAVLHRLPDMVRLLMAHGADARKGIYPHRDATTALALATERGYDEIVAIIHDAERRRPHAHRDLSETGPTLMSGELRDAIHQGDAARVIAVLDASPALKADPALIDTYHLDRSTLLHVAAARGMDRLATWLLDRGADANRRSGRGDTPLDVLGRWPSASGAEGMRRVSDVLLRHGAERTPCWAVAMGETEWLRARAAEGVRVNPALTEGRLLTLAARLDRPDVVERATGARLRPRRADACGWPRGGRVFEGLPPAALRRDGEAGDGADAS
jgi:hypothetical protein